MTLRLPRLILLAALALEGALPARAEPPRNPPLPPARPVFPDDPPTPAESDASQAAAPEGVSQQAAYGQPASVASQYAPNPPPSNGPFGALFAPSQTAFAQPAPAAPPPEAASPQPAPLQSASLRTPPVAAGPANYPEPPVDSPVGQEEAVEGFAIAEKAGLADMTRKYARQHGIPLALLHRIIMRESKYCPRLVNRSYYGLMQITPATARSMGYHGAPRGLLDPETNLAYAAPYLANAWALADGDMDRAVRLYASGYYYTAKSKHMLSQMRDAKSPPVKPQLQTIAQAPPPPPPPSNVFEAMFGSPNR
jgi:soluble lytic murein transglycosylase-like protein